MEELITILSKCIYFLENVRQNVLEMDNMLDVLVAFVACLQTGPVMLLNENKRLTLVNAELFKSKRVSAQHKHEKVRRRLLTQSQDIFSVLQSS